MNNYENTPSQKRFFDLIEESFIPDTDKEMSIYQNPDKLPLVKDINGIQDSYSDSEFLDLINKAFSRYFDDHVKYEVSLLERQLAALKKTPNPVQITYKRAKKSDIIKVLDKDFKDFYNKIETHRKQFLKSIIDKAYVDAHNLDIEIDMPRHTICKYIACKFTYLNYKDPKIYNLMKQFALFIKQFRSDNRNIIFDKDLTYYVSLLNKSDEYTRHQYVNTIDALGTNIVNKFQDNSKWIKIFLEDTVASKIV